MFQKWENLKIWYSSIYWTTTTLIETANKNCRSNSRLTKNSSVFVASKNINKILFFVCHQHWLPTDLHMPSTWYKNLHSTKLIFNQKHSTSLDVLIFVIKKNCVMQPNASAFESNQSRNNLRNVKCHMTYEMRVTFFPHWTCQSLFSFIIINNPNLIWNSKSYIICSKHFLCPTIKWQTSYPV